MAITECQNFKQGLSDSVYIVKGAAARRPFLYTIIGFLRIYKMDVIYRIYIHLVNP
jgi:hypothetical protein